MDIFEFEQSPHSCIPKRCKAQPNLSDTMKIRQTCIRSFTEPFPIVQCFTSERKRRVTDASDRYTTIHTITAYEQNMREQFPYFERKFSMREQTERPAPLHGLYRHRYPPRPAVPAGNNVTSRPYPLSLGARHHPSQPTNNGRSHPLRLSA